MKRGALEEDMPIHWRHRFILILSVIFVMTGFYFLFAWDPLPVADDPLVRMPGTQPEQLSLEGPNRCLNCHAGYNQDRKSVV